MAKVEGQGIASTYPGLQGPPPPNSTWSLQTQGLPAPVCHSSPVILLHYRKPRGSVLEAIGDTPLDRLRRVVADLPVEAFAKLEFMNPMGSS
jgi:hypothetical protein